MNDEQWYELPSMVRVECADDVCIFKVNYGLS